MKRRESLIKQGVALLISSLLFSHSIPGHAVQEISPLKAVMDVRIELLYIIDATANASSWHNCQLMNTIYNQQVIKHFSPYQKHEAVQYYLKFIQGKFDFSYLERAFLSLPYSLQKDEIIVLDQWPIELGLFIDKALAFYQDSEFKIFMLRQSSIIREMERSYQGILNRQQWQESYLAWFSESLAQFRVVLSPLKRFSHQGYLIKLNDELPDYTLVLGLTAINNGYLVFAPSKDLQKLILLEASYEMIWHEMEFFPEKMALIEEALLSSNDTWIDLGFTDSSQFVAYQMAMCMYWKVLDDLDQDDSAIQYIQEAEEAGYFLIKPSWNLFNSFSQAQDSLSWKAYTPIWMDSLLLDLAEKQV
jgi:hypothetical protein